MNNLRERYVQAIKDILKSLYIENEFLECANIQEEVDFVVAGEKSVIDSNDINLEAPNYCSFIFVGDLLEKLEYENAKDEYKKEAIKDKVLDLGRENFKQRTENKFTDGANLFFIFSELKHEVWFKSVVGSDTKLKRDIEEMLQRTFEKDDIEYKFITIVKSTHSNFNIEIESRVKSLEMNKSIVLGYKDKGELNVNGYVFTTKLYDLVKLYNNLGSDLFNSNVRFNIKDELDVDSNIKKTLKDSPNDFWYLNNGVSIIIEDDDFMLKKEKYLEINYSKDKKVSVINGAQTISASAEFFFKPLDNDKEKEIREEAKKNAKVILKVINFNKSNLKVNGNTVVKKEIDKVSIGLNRQKPIRSEDVAYTQPFIYQINKLSEKIEDKYRFLINRRGEDKAGIGIVEFSRIVRAYLEQKPGGARSNGANVLLKINYDKDRETNNFKEKGIFKELDYNGEITEEMFYKYYRPVNFANELEHRYSNKVKQMKKGMDNEKKAAVLSYGKWYFIAYIIYEINGFNNDDFTNFTYLSGDELNIDKLILKFIDEFVECHRNKDKFDSNDFKKDGLYNEFCNYMKEGDGIIKNIKNEVMNEVAGTIAD